MKISEYKNGNSNDYNFFRSQIKQKKMKNTAQLLNYLEYRFKVKEFPIENLSDSLLKAEKYNALHSYGADLIADSFEFRANQIVKDEKSTQYFSEKLTDYTPLAFSSDSAEEDELLLFLHEEQTNHFWINNSCLWAELIVERGISHESHEKKDVFFQEYEFAKKQIQEYKKREKGKNHEI